MKKHIAKLIVLILLAGLLSVYWQIRNVDPEGACKGFRNFSMCWDAWMEYDHDGLFKQLPSDQNMIDRFHTYRSDFYELKDLKFGFVPDKLLQRTSAWYVGSFGYWPSAAYSDTAQSDVNHQDFARTFPVSETMYITGAEKNWPKINRQKGYAYFPLPIPRIEQGRLLGPMLNGQKLSWRVLEQLDKDWPTDWASYECLLRPIEPQWFLFICKDHIGG